MSRRHSDTWSPSPVKDKKNSKKSKPIEPILEEDSMSRSRSRSRSRSGSRSRGSKRDKHDRRSESPSRGRRGHRSRERDRRRSPSLPRSYKDNASPALRGARSRSRSHSRERFPHHRNRNIGVFGLSYRTSKRDLEYEFRVYGPIESVDLVTDPSGESRGFGFVLFDYVEDADAAVAKMNGATIDRHRIRVDYSTSKGPRPKTPGQYMGARSHYRDNDRIIEGRFRDARRRDEYDDERRREHRRY